MINDFVFRGIFMPIFTIITLIVASISIIVYFTTDLYKFLQSKKVRTIDWIIFTILSLFSSGWLIFAGSTEGNPDIAKAGMIALIITVVSSIVYKTKIDAHDDENLYNIIDLQTSAYTTQNKAESKTQKFNIGTVGAILAILSLLGIIYMAFIYFF